MDNLSRILAIAVLPLMFFSHLLKADPITLTTFDYPGESQTLLDGINGQDQIVGRYGDDIQYGGASVSLFIMNAQGPIATTWSFPYPDDVYGAYGIDNSGDVAGSYNSRGSVYYLRAADGTFSPLPFPTGAGTAAMNNDGNLVYSGGQSLYFPNGDGTFTSVSVPGASEEVTVTGYDDQGDVVGYAYSGTSAFSFFRNASGNFTIIDVPGSVYTEALGMNDLGQVVGVYYDGAIDHGFMWSAATGFTTVDHPGAQLTLFDGISDDGTLVGGYIPLDGSYFQGLIGTETASTPEPKSLAVIALGLLLLIVCRSRRRLRFRRILPT